MLDSVDVIRPTLEGLIQEASSDISWGNIKSEDILPDTWYVPLPNKKNLGWLRATRNPEWRRSLEPKTAVLRDHIEAALKITTLSDGLRFASIVDPDTKTDILRQHKEICTSQGINSYKVIIGDDSHNGERGPVTLLQDGFILESNETGSDGENKSAFIKTIKSEEATGNKTAQIEYAVDPNVKTLSGSYTRTILGRGELMLNHRAIENYHTQEREDIKIYFDLPRLGATAHRFENNRSEEEINLRKIRFTVDVTVDDPNDMKYGRGLTKHAMFCFGSTGELLGIVAERYHELNYPDSEKEMQLFDGRQYEPRGRHLVELVFGVTFGERFIVDTKATFDKLVDSFSRTDNPNPLEFFVTNGMRVKQLTGSSSGFRDNL